jgi:hypothetical protein
VIRVLVQATADPGRVHSGLVEHQAEMIRRCPYLGPSVQRGLTEWSAVEAGPGDEPALFAFLVDHAEQVRAARRAHGPLVCHNVALLSPTDDQAAKRLMERPVWVARNLYAPVQIVVDRFWIGVGRRPGEGRSVMPHVPVSYFMIRCGIANRDRVIVSPRPADELAALRAGPGDDGRDVIATQLGWPVTDPADAWNPLMNALPVPARS